LEEAAKPSCGVCADLVAASGGEGDGTICETVLSSLTARSETDSFLV
jgi:hypothetical protein